MPELFAAVCSIAPTRRRRFLWVAWWTAPPSRDPFRKPDAFAGGARTREEALSDAERVAGMHLVEIEPRWARAWGRVMIGLPPWLVRERAGEPAEGEGRASASPRASREEGAREPARPSVWAILGTTRDATEAELKRAFRERVLATHPDRRGTAESFREVQRAFEEAQRRIARPRRRRR